MLVFQQFLQYHGKGEGAIVIKIPRVKCFNSTNIYSQHPGFGSSEEPGHCSDREKETTVVSGPSA